MTVTFAFIMATDARPGGAHAFLIFIDGACNDRIEVEVDEGGVTNVLKLARLIGTADGRREVYYHRGPAIRRKTCGSTSIDHSVCRLPDNYRPRRCLHV